MNIFTIVLGIMTAIGVFLTIYFGVKFNRLQKKNRTLSWNDIQIYADSISLCLKQDRFVPQVILAPGIRGAIIAEISLNKFERNIPVFIGISYRDFTQECKLTINNYETFTITKDWDILIPKAIFGFTDKKILVVDDFCLTGEFFQKLRSFLTSNGFDEEKIRIYSCIITAVTKSAERAPEYYSRIVEDDYIYFPWGKANMG